MKMTVKGGVTPHQRRVILASLYGVDLHAGALRWIQGEPDGVSLEQLKIMNEHLIGRRKRAGKKGQGRIQNRQRAGREPNEG